MKVHYLSDSCRWRDSGQVASKLGDVSCGRCLWMMNKPNEGHRFWEKVRKTKTCWVWTSSRLSHGHGQFRSDSGMVMAHRFAYESLRGPIPGGKVLDHICRNPPCVNPDHLELVTNVENVMRGISPHAINARKTLCARGHVLSVHQSNQRWRMCRVCLSEQAKIRRLKRRPKR